MRNHYDVAVVGGGPVGLVTAIAFARRGARVIVLEADPRASRRFAGEWIHPSGVAVLDALRAGRLEHASPRPGYGFVILPGDRSEPIELPYPDGVALSCPHDSIVEGLRAVAEGVSGVEVVTFARVVAIEENKVSVEVGGKAGGSSARSASRAASPAARGRMEISAGRVVGADGRASIARRSLGLPENSALLSYMASVELRGVELPFEGFGHVILGGPGPALLYRIGDGRVRGCLDVPLCHGAASRTPAFLWNAFGSVLPASLVPAFRRALEEGPIAWAATRFRPRAHFGDGVVSLAGDALGHVHPMTAIGLSMGFLDAQSLARTSGHRDYARARRGYVPELLANALYHCFRRQDASAAGMREAMFRVLRASSFERRRTMSMLCAEESSFSTFGSAFLRVAAGAIGRTASRAIQGGSLRELPAALAAYGEWMQWPAAGLVPAPLRDAYRARSTSTRPIPLVSSLIPTSDEAHAGARNEASTDGASEAGSARGLRGKTLDAAASAVAASPALAVTKATEALLRELEALAAQLGKLPDAVIGGPALRMMRGITTTEMRPGVAARMAIGRRWLAHEGFARLLSEQRPRQAISTSDVAELCLLLLGGSTWIENRIAQLEGGVDLILERQTKAGGFAAYADDAEPVQASALASLGPLPDRRLGLRSAAALETTALACRALALLRRRKPGVFDARIAPALEHAARWIRAQQEADGSFAPTDEEDRIAATAWAVEALAATGASPGDPELHRSASWIAAQQRAGGGFSEAAPAAVQGADVHSDVQRTTARALRALLAAHAAHPSAIEAGVALLSTAIAEADHAAAPPAFAVESAFFPPNGEPARARAPWEATWEILEVLAMYEAMKKARPEPLRRAPPAASALGDADWVFCRERLGEVSRSFSRPIALLPRHLEIAVTLGYLLCRVADTIEDHAAVPGASRDSLFAVFLEVLEAGKSAEPFAASFAEIPGDDAELTLARNLPVVMRVFRAQSEATRACSIRWISEMARGMGLYAHREPGADGIIALHTTADLERYCYFVAGTVGHLLTDLFLTELGREATPELALTLRAHAEAFGAGLQLVNILKDLTDDRARSWSFVPRTACAAVGIEVADLADPAHRSAAHAAVAPLFDVAKRHLDDGLSYALAIPGHHAGIRRFCLLPLWMAARTLVLARGNDAMFTPGEPVKITREEVELITAACVMHSADDAELRARYARLWVPGKGSRALSSSQERAHAPSPRLALLVGDTPYPDPPASAETLSRLGPDIVAMGDDGVEDASSLRGRSRGAPT